MDDYEKYLGYFIGGFFSAIFLNIIPSRVDILELLNLIPSSLGFLFKIIDILSPIWIGLTKGSWLLKEVYYNVGYIAGSIVYIKFGGSTVTVFNYILLFAYFIATSIIFYRESFQINHEI